MARHVFNFYAEEEWGQRMRVIPVSLRNVRRLPPHHSPLNKIVCVSAGCFEYRLVRKFFVATENDDARPVIVILDFINFETDQWVGTHPLYFLPECCKTVEIVSVVKGKVERQHIRVILIRASQPAKPRSRQGLVTL